MPLKNIVEGFKEIWAPIADVYMRTLEDPVEQAWAARELAQWITSMGTVKKHADNRHIKEVVKILDAKVVGGTICDSRIKNEGDAVWLDTFRGGLEQRCKQISPKTNRIRHHKRWANAERTHHPPPHMGRAMNHLTNELKRWHNRLCAVTPRPCRHATTS